MIVDIEPASGAVITEKSFEAKLTFNNPLLDLTGETNAELATKLEGATEWVSHEVVITDRELTATINLDESGNYDLRWKVISSDGHPITGESTFTLELDPIAEQPTPEPILIAPNPTAEPAGQDDSLSGFYIGLAMVALGAIFAPIGLLMRRRAKKS